MQGPHVRSNLDFYSYQIHRFGADAFNLFSFLRNLMMFGQVDHQLQTYTKIIAPYFKILSAQSSLQISKK